MMTVAEYLGWDVSELKPVSRRRRRDLPMDQALNPPHRSTDSPTCFFLVTRARPRSAFTFQPVLFERL